MIPDNYLEKVYSGFLGMNIGIRLGAPVEPTIWTYERIRDTYGDITGYVKDYKNFAADDDANGPVYFLRALVDDAKDRAVTPQDVARAWLNYTREGVGMFWWGGYGISTEHTAYLNLKHGIPAPRSGSQAQNGKTLAEQIGGQIFIDTWGLVHPGNPGLAAEYGEAAASVSHDGEGVYGARFFCACIAQAFISRDIKEVIQIGLSEIPSQSLYHQVAEAVLSYHKAHQEDWRGCHHMLVEEWGYDRYPGVCHMIPNAGVCILAMIYGDGNFSRTVEIATMCGWDTDCNAGNVGTVLGVMTGIDGLPEHYRRPINDGLILSGISGYLNNLDIPSYAKEVAALGYRLQGLAPCETVAERAADGEIYFDFTLPGSTHNMRLSDSFFCRSWHSDQMGFRRNGSLKVLVDRMVRGDQCKLYYKPFYRRDEFSDERYSPVLTPTVYSGQVVSMEVYLEQWNGWETLGFAPYIRTAGDKKDHLQGYVKLQAGQWNHIEFTVPDTYGDLVDEVGILLEGYSDARAKTLGLLYLDEFRVRGKACYTIDFAKQREEFASVTPFAVDHGAWELSRGELSLMRCGQAFAYGGNYYARDYSVAARVTPQNGEHHVLTIRCQGAMRGYMAGLGEYGKVSIYKNNFGFVKLAETEFTWETGQDYQLILKAEGSRITLFIDGAEILQIEDEDFTYGMYGCGSLSMGRTLFGTFLIEQESTAT